jgi:hypothetical protein
MKEKLYIECRTCKYNDIVRCGNTNSSYKCLVPSKSKMRLVIDGKMWIGKYRYFYYLWKPKKTVCHLPEDVFEI